MQITTINSMGVNCYLIQNDNGFYLIDTGFGMKRDVVDKAIQAAGCFSGQLKMIVITHADGDHIGNAAYFRQKYASILAMHIEEDAAALSGNLLKSRKSTNLATRIFLTILLPLVGIKKSDRFTPDVHISDGFDLNSYGLDAVVVDLPGHSNGSIGLLTSDGSLFCGDLLTNMEQPALNSNIDDKPAAMDSFEKISKYQINTIFPGHGNPFPMELLLQGNA